MKSILLCFQLFSFRLHRKYWVIWKEISDFLTKTKDDFFISRTVEFNRFKLSMILRVVIYLVFIGCHWPFTTCYKSTESSFCTDAFCPLIASTHIQSFFFLTSKFFLLFTQAQKQSAPEMLLSPLGPLVRRQKQKQTKIFLHKHSAF